MIKAVIDTHGLLNSIPKSGSYRWLYDAFIREEFIWVFSNEIISEYAETINREFDAQAMEIVFSILLTSINTQRYEPSYKWQLVTTDPDDNRSGEPQIRRLRHRCQCRLFSHQRQAHS
ncbi:putative toxin-antitoxin system toxin component, PIN family [Runella sp. CRIBMP]|uniref:PIN domain-containing protein n=1 Tax=Runella sp. CRIBMP TaxID=2683261 RepID=UPI001E3A943F|nr:PIN domain-containing protein [Runella sp. CRIBMP]